jgi:tripartite-type tricarboxylate transporter receptor subunit TctC
MNRRKILKTGLASLATTTLAPLGALAQGSGQGSGQARYPERPIRLVVPFAPGGATDVAGRLWAEKMKPLIGTVVVENKPSGGGAPGTTEVARAQPDGYTLLFGNTSTQVLLPVLMPKPPYDPVKDFTAISILCVSPTVIVVNEKVPVRTLRELIAYAKANPGKLSYGSAGTGTLTNLAGELFKQLIGAPDIVHIPYKGSAPGVADLAAGHIPMMTPNIGGPLIDFHRTGRVKILAVAQGCARHSDRDRGRAPWHGGIELQRAVRAGRSLARDRRRARAGDTQGDGRSGIPARAADLRFRADRGFRPAAGAAPR